MSVRLACPSCNTAFDLDAVPADRRATCPRCGDVFPVRGELAEPAPAAPPVLVPKTDHAPPVHKRKWSCWLVVTGALALVLLGFAIGLLAYHNRGSKPNDEPQPEPPVSATATPPAQLVGLGYLSAECNVVFAVQPGPVLEYAARSKRDPRALLTQWGLPQQVFGALDATGLPLAHIDHLAGGLFLPSGPEELRAALVLVLKQPLPDEPAFLKKLEAKPLPGGKSRYEVALGKLPGGEVARVSPTVWVFGLSAGDFAAAEKGGFGPGGTQFRGTADEGFRKMLGSVPTTAAVWIAADDEREWTEKPVAKFFAQSADLKKLLPALSGGRGGMFALSFGENPRMQLFVRTAETATAERVRTYFQARAAELESATAGGGGVLALFDAPADPALVRRFLADAAK